jgi:hypothetical protein
LDVGETDWVDAVPSRVVSSEHVALDPEYHWKVFDPMPPDGFAVRVIDCPLSIVGAEGVMDPANNAGLTVTVSAAEHCETGDKAESVTL